MVALEWRISVQEGKSTILPNFKTTISDDSGGKERTTYFETRNKQQRKKNKVKQKTISNKNKEKKGMCGKTFKAASDKKSSSCIAYKHCPRKLNLQSTSHAINRDFDCGNGHCTANILHNGRWWLLNDASVHSGRVRLPSCQHHNGALWGTRTID